MLLEKNLVRDRGWVEFSVYPLFSPQSLIAEGTANFGIEVAFPRTDRLEFERRVLFPAAQLKSEMAAAYYDVLALVERLSYAGNEAARRYLERPDRRARRPRTGSNDTACIPAPAPSSASASSTSTAAT